MKNKSAIRRLLLDDPCSLEKMGLNEEQSRLLDVLSDLEEQINKKFADDEESLNLFKKYKDVLDDLNFEESCCCFEHWIKFGVKFGMELEKD